MSRRRQRTLETISGSGVLEGNGKKVPVNYRVVVSITELETMPNEWIDGLKHIEGNVVAEDDFALMAIHFGTGEATLHMENHQHFDCFLSDVRGGRLVARGNNRPEGSCTPKGRASMGDGSQLERLLTVREAAERTGL